MGDATFTNLVRTEQRTAITTLLKLIMAGTTISTAKGPYTFNNTLTEGRIFDPPASPENMNDLPAVNLETGPESCANINLGSQLQTGGNQQLWHNSYTFTLETYLAKTDNPKLEQEKMLADQMVLFGVNYNLPNGSNIATCFNVIYSGSDFFGMKGNQPKYVLISEWLVIYRLYNVDPFRIG